MHACRDLDAGDSADERRGLCLAKLLEVSELFRVLDRAQRAAAQQHVRSWPSAREHSRLAQQLAGSSCSGLVDAVEHDCRALLAGVPESVASLQHPCLQVAVDVAGAQVHGRGCAGVLELGGDRRLVVSLAGERLADTHVSAQHSQRSLFARKCLGRCGPDAEFVGHR